jgi:hypothetical protein
MHHRGLPLGATVPLWIVAVAVGLVLPRVILIANAWPVLIESDEAIVGLMARHILAGHLPVWFYGQAYMGTLEPATAALLFAVFGASPLVLKMVPFVWFCAFLVAHYQLAREIGGARVAHLATLLAAASPAFLTVWSLKSEGGYMALLCLGTVALLLTIRLLVRGVTARRAGALGFVLGLAWWTQFLAIAYIVPIVLLLMVTRRREVWSRAAAVFVAAGVLGSGPFWIYNVLREWASLRMSAPDPAPFGSGLFGFIRTAVPIIMGTRPEDGIADFFPLGSTIAVVLFLVALAAPLLRWPLVKVVPGARYGVLVLVGLFAFFPVLFASSGFGGVVRVPRYVIPLYSGLYILLLIGFSRFGQVLLTSCLLVVHVAGSLRTSPIDLATTLNAEPNTDLIAFLHANHATHAYAPYWVAYRLTFETGEQIICTPPDGGGVRYTPHLRVVEAHPAPAYIRLTGPQYEGRHAPVAVPPEYVVTRIGHYDVFLPPHAPDGRPTDGRH